MNARVYLFTVGFDGNELWKCCESPEVPNSEKKFQERRDGEKLGTGTKRSKRPGGGGLEKV